MRAPHLMCTWDNSNADNGGSVDSGGRNAGIYSTCQKTYKELKKGWHI